MLIPDVLYGNPSDYPGKFVVLVKALEERRKYMAAGQILLFMCKIQG